MNHKEAQWEKKKIKIANELFPKRIVQDVLKYQCRIKGDRLHRTIKENTGLYLYGPTGSGKTVYACSYLLEINKYARFNNLSFGPYKFITFLDLLAKIKNSFNGNGNEIEIIEEYCNAGVLVLDDIGVEKVSEWTLQTLQTIINHRYNHLKITIITSNLDLNALSKSLNDDRIPSRICGMCKIKKFTGKDFRVSKGI